MCTADFITHCFVVGFFRRDLPAALSGVYEQILSSTDKLLEERGSAQLPAEVRESLRGQVSALADADCAVRKLLCKCNSVWLQAWPRLCGTLLQNAMPRQST